MSNSPAWSHTSLTTFEQCPKKYFHTKVAKDVKEVFGEEAEWGQRVHKMLEDRLKVGTALPDYLSHCEPIAEDIKSRDGELLVEEKICLNENFQVVSWFDKKAWARSVLDVGVVNERHAVILDWKTGKRKPDNDQMRLFSGIAFKRFPWVDKIVTAFVWLKENKIDKQVFTRKQDEPAIWGEIMPRVERLNHAYENARWPAKPSGLCKGWCPVKSCEHWQARK
jgi:hypothetical protein